MNISNNNNNNNNNNSINNDIILPINRWLSINTTTYILQHKYRIMLKNIINTP